MVKYVKTKQYFVRNIHKNFLFEILADYALTQSI